MATRTILLVTVGGSHQPILRSIEQNKPDFVHFICSDDGERSKGSYTQVVGDGLVLSSKRPEQSTPDLPNIVTLAKLAVGQFQIHKVKHLDNLNECYLQAASLIEQIHVEIPDASVIADYTGGTKSMTAGLAAAALDDGQCEIRLVTGARLDLQIVADRTEFVRPIHVWDTQVARQLRVAIRFIARYDYASAAAFLEETSRRFASDATLERLTRWITFCRAFDAWDRFDHQAAQALLKAYEGYFGAHKASLSMLLGGKNHHGWELVEDLLLNAERRAVQARYDDATGRLYRATELTAQIWLKKQHAIDTGAVSLTQLPESMRGDLQRKADGAGLVKLGLRDAWNLLAALPADSFGTVYRPRQKHLLTFLNTRNDSLFAHGLRPVQRHDYEQAAQLVGEFLRHAIEAGISSLALKRIAAPKQLPHTWE